MTRSRRAFWEALWLVGLVVVGLAVHHAMRPESFWHALLVVTALGVAVALRVVLGLWLDVWFVLPRALARGLHTASRSELPRADR